MSGKSLMFRGIRYLDVMRWQKDMQDEAARKAAKEAMHRRAKRAL
jgi:hypothetical protein